jgi:integral membrane protein (TIGR03766 family)
LKAKLFHLLNYIFYIFILYTIYGAVRSSLLNIDSLPDRIFSVVFAVLGFLIVIGYSERTKNWAKVKFNVLLSVLYSHRKKITVGLFIIVFMLQIIILRNITAPITWDVGHIFNGVTNLPEDPERINRYLSINPNNSFFAFLMYGITQTLNAISRSGEFGETWFAWQLINTQLLNLGFILLFLAAKSLLNEKIAYIAFYLAFIPLALSPWLLVPYTDVIMIPVISLCFICYSKLRKINTISVHFVLLSLLLGIGIAICYLLKPSSIIFVIAWLCISFITVLDKRQWHISKFQILSSIFIMTGLIGMVSGVQLYESNQQLVEINEEMAKPWNHFMMMGLKGDGGYNTEDSQMMNSLPTQEEKKEYANEEIKNRLKNHGVLGYPKFLMGKHIRNTARGDFGWGQDGAGQTPESASESRLQEILRELYYQQANGTQGIRLFMHFCWIITLFGLLKAYAVIGEGNVLQILKLGILGSFLFLLLFEGGRSRYLIQFLPMYYFLSAVGWAEVFESFKEKLDMTRTLKDN